MIRLNEPDIDESDVEAVTEALRSGWLGVSGTQTRQFEQEYAKRLGHEWGIAVQSGTAATHAALWAALEFRRAERMYRGGHIAVPEFTCSAPAAAAVQAGATPIFVDVEERTLGMSAERLMALDPDEIDVVVLVHVYGAPAHDAVAIRQWCKDNDITLVEDCAEAHGAFDAEGPVGSQADVAVFSVRSEKVIGVGEGGLLTTNNGVLAGIAEMFVDRGKYRADEWVWKFATAVPGYNYRLPHLLGALALSQLQRMDGFVERRREIAHMYRSILPALSWQEQPPGSSGWLNFLRLPVAPGDGRALEDSGISPFVKDIGDRLFAAGIEVRPGFLTLSRHLAFRAGRRKAMSVSDHAVWSGLCLPSHPRLTDQDVATVCRNLFDAMEAVL